jgi:glutamyl/glutaminyl-tRNA synthetase
MSQVRVRIAPSPTGYLHVGTARTAVFNYLFARRYGGRFLVRIEDTDTERSRTELIQPILDALSWLGMKPDEEIIYQSQRLEYYKGFAVRLLESGHAYRDFSTREELQAERERAQAEKRPMRFEGRDLSDDEIATRLDRGMPFAIRLRIPEGETSFDDIVTGTITRQNSEIDDLIIARSDGSATYNLAVVIDRALGWDIPQFCHLPLILRPDKKKVSKRLGDKDVVEYREDGILPDAMFNYLCLLGWSPKTDREIYAPDELIELFDERNFNASNAVFDEEKLVAFNQDYIARMSDHDLAVLVAPLLVDAGLTTKYWLETRWEYLRTVMGLLKERVRRLTEFAEKGAYFFSFNYTYDQVAAAKRFKPDAAGRLKTLAERFEQLGSFTKSSTEETLSELAGELDVGKGQLIHPTRLAVTGVSAGPGLYDILSALGRETVVERMRKAVDYIEHLQQTT